MDKITTESNQYEISPGNATLPEAVKNVSPINQQLLRGSSFDSIIEIQINQCLTAFQCSVLPDFFDKEEPLITSGTFGNVQIATYKKNLPHAQLADGIKVVIKTDKQDYKRKLTHSENEHFILQQSRHQENPEILSILKTATDKERFDTFSKFIAMYITPYPQDTHLVICNMVFQYIPGFSFYEICNRLDVKILEKYTAFFFTEMNKIYDFLYAYKIIHNDFHPGNCRYDPTTNRLKLIDFGYAFIETQYDDRFKIHHKYDQIRSMFFFSNKVLPIELHQDSGRISCRKITQQLNSIVWENYANDYLSVDSVKLMTQYHMLGNLAHQNGATNCQDIDLMMSDCSDLDRLFIKSLQLKPNDCLFSTVTAKLCDELNHLSA
ncbi:MAG: protein kinase family protein [Endozoicomonadaceae bacterium]|nr:protein kinase family protein [Endozoicomonadaceae bacterium]